MADDLDFLHTLLDKKVIKNISGRNATIVQDGTVISLDLSSIEIQEFPDNFRFPSTLVILNLYDNELEELPLELFQGLTDLVSLKIRKNRLKVLQKGLLDDNHILRHFDVSLNQISEVASDFFTATPHLKEINLESNNLSILPDELFVGLSNLESLSMALNQLERLPTSIVNLSLKRLNLIGNPELKNLAKKYISQLQIQKVTQSLSNSTKN